MFSLKKKVSIKTFDSLDIPIILVFFIRSRSATFIFKKFSKEDFRLGLFMLTVTLFSWDLLNPEEGQGFFHHFCTRWYCPYDPKNNVRRLKHPQVPLTRPSIKIQATIPWGSKITVFNFHIQPKSCFFDSFSSHFDFCQNSIFLGKENGGVACRKNIKHVTFSFIY